MWQTLVRFISYNHIQAIMFYIMDKFIFFIYNKEKSGIRKFSWDISDFGSEWESWDSNSLNPSRKTILFSW